MGRSPAEAAKRRTASRVVQAVLVAGIAALALAAAYISVLVFDRQAALNKISRYNVAFSASQGMNELLRFRHRLAALMLDPPRATKDDVQLRYYILVNRQNLFESGEFRQFTSATPENKEAIRRLSRILERIGTLLDDIDKQENARLALELTEPLESKLIALASEANEYGATAMARDQNELLRLHWIFSALALCLVLGGFVIIMMLRWQHGLQVAAQQRLEATNEDLRRTTAELAQSVAESERANDELANQNHLFNTALNNMSHGLCMFDDDQKLIVSNEKLETVYGLKPGQLKQGLTLADFMRQTIGAHEDDPGQMGGIGERQALLIKENRSGTLMQQLQDGRAVQISHQPMEGGGWVATYEDITERHKAQAQIAHMARHDTLTDLPNRVLLQERLKKTLARSSKNGRHTAVMCIDLDRFKSVNDTLGHPAGDALLREVATRILGTIRAKDTVARLGGDEFVVVQSDLEHPGDAEHLARRLIELIDEPFLIEGHQALTGASIGIATTMGDSDATEDLLIRADVALYQAKADGRGTFRFYEPEMNARLKRRRILEDELRSADLDEQFHLVFQPIVTMDDSKVTALEALLRWEHPDHGLLPPDEFIPVAEDTGMIVAIGEWVLRKACGVIAQLPDDVNIAVNLSPMQFKRDDIVGTVARVLSEAGVKPERLELEITETLLLEDSGKIQEDLKRLRKLGTRISLDDFGTGYSSLSYLQKFAADKIKIDRLFVKEIATISEHKAVVQTIIDLAHKLGMKTVVEGVETKEQLRILRSMGCDEAQGFYFSRPMKTSRIASFLKDYARRRSAA